MTSQKSPAVPIRSLNASASLSISDVNLMEAGAKTMSLRDLTGDTTNESTDVDYSSVANVSFPPTEELHAGSQRSGRKQRRRTLLLIAAGLLCAALLVGLGVGLAVHHSSSPGSKEAQTHDQVPATLEEVVAYLVTENVSRESDLTNDKAPQYKAAQWLSQVDGARLALPTTSLSSQDNRSRSCQFGLDMGERLH